MKNLGVAFGGGTAASVPVWLVFSVLVLGLAAAYAHGEQQGWKQAEGKA